MNELERVEAQALRDAVAAGGGRAETVGGALCVTHPRIPMAELNRAIPLGAHVDAAVINAWFDGRAHSVCEPPGYLGLAESLRALGYESGSAWMKFRRGDAPAAPATTDLRVEQTADPDAFAIAAGLPAELAGFVGEPGWLHFIAWAGDEPVGSGALYTDSELAWVGVGTTREAWRGRGAQSALLATRIEAGRRLGVRQFVTESGEDSGPSYRNILRAGFEEAYSRATWRSPESSGLSPRGRR